MGGGIGALVRLLGSCPAHRPAGNGISRRSPRRAAGTGRHSRGSRRPALSGMESVAGDLWSGFTRAPSSAATGPGLVTPAPAGTSGNGGEFALGVALLGAGLVALGAGTGATVLRRSRVRAATGSRTVH